MDQQKITRQYGLWKSPITPISLARGIGFSDVAWDSDGTLIWRESRSDRGVLVVQPADGQAFRDLNNDFNIRAQVGYGGGDFTAGQGNVYFIDGSSGRIYRQPTHKGLPEAITPEFAQCASPALSPDGRWLVYVSSYEGQDSLGIVDTHGLLWPAKLASGDDFYMQPCWHPNGRHLAWVAWNHPNMPWDGTFLRLGTLDTGEGGRPYLKEMATVAGGEDESIFQPQFSPDGRSLAFVSDRSGWWQLYLYDLESAETRQLTSIPAEHAEPAWNQGYHMYGFSPDSKIIYFLRSQEAFISLHSFNLEDGKESAIDLGDEYTDLSQLAVSPLGDRLALLASGSKTPPRVITIQLQDPPQARVWRRYTAEDIPPEAYSACEPISWAGLDGGTAYGLFYPPNSMQFIGNGVPPLLVQIHGGPTGQVGTGFNPRAQFFTSRGYAVLEVNYRGSTGYGREYRNALCGKWGIYDVEDAVSGARALADQGRVDVGRIVIMGGSAGGFTVLKAMEDFPGFFKAGICLYGVSNQFTLAADTHKFEAHYSDSLLGPLPEAANIYRERSPIFFVDKIQDPVIIFQGEIDKVVPRSQSDTIVEALRRRGVPHEYHLYPGEGHGFRKTETIEDYLKASERFLQQYVLYA